MQPEERATHATVTRLVAALVREGLCPGQASDGTLVLDLPGGRVTAALGPHADLAWLRPSDLVGPVTLGDTEGPDPRDVLDAAQLEFAKSRQNQVRQKLRSAVVHGAERWEATPRAPRLEGPAVAWARTVRDGDPLDPGAGSRTGWTARQTRTLDVACGDRVSIVRVALPATSVKRLGAWRGRWLGDAGAGEAVVPVHPGGLDALRAARPDARELEGRLPARLHGPLGQVLREGVSTPLWLSLRVVPGPRPDPVQAAVVLGPRVREVAPAGLGVVADLGALVVPGALAAVSQEAPEAIWPGDRFVCAAALEQVDAEGVPVLRRLPGADRGLAWFSAWSGRLLDAALPLLEQGVLLPDDPALWWLHLRNRRPVGVVAQAWWAARVHPPTLRPHASVDGLDALAVPSREVLFARGFHTLVARHLGRLARLLEIGPEGFRVVRDHLDRIVPAGTPLHRAWTAWTVPHPCALRSRLEGREVTRDLPNPLA